MSHPINVCLAVALLASPALSQRTPVTRPMNRPAMQIAPLDAQAVAFNATLTPRLTPTAKSWIHSEAMAAAAQHLDDAAVVGMIRKDAAVRFANQGATPVDIEAMVQLVMLECAQNADADLRGQLAEMDAANARAERLGGMSQEQTLKLQAAMLRKSQYETMLGNMMKASSKASSAMIGNLK